MSDRLAKDAKLQRKSLENKQMRSKTDCYNRVMFHKPSAQKPKVFHQHEIAKKMEGCYF